MENQMTVAVDYREEGGWHIFTSEDVPELIVAHTDPLLAYNDVAVVLGGLFRLNKGIECTFSPEITADEFLAHLEQESLRINFRKAA